MEILIFLLIWAACGWGGFAIMQSKGRSASLGLLLGLVLGIFGVIICAVVPKSFEKRIEEQALMDAALRRMRGE